MTMICMRSPHRVDHCYFSMGTFAAMLGPYFKFCEVCDCGNKPKDLPFQSCQSDVFIFLCCQFLLLQEIFYVAFLYLVMMFFSCLSQKSFPASFGYFKKFAPLSYCRKNKSACFKRGVARWVRFLYDFIICVG